MTAAQDDVPAVRRLPQRPPLREGQALDSYLEQLAQANHLRTADVFRMISSATDTTKFLMLAPTERTLHVLARLTGLEPTRLRSSTLARYGNTALDLTGLDPHRQASYRTVAGRGWVPGTGTQICPGCLAETNTWKIAWRLPTTTTCTNHGAYLLATCPGCDEPFRAPRHTVLRPAGNTTTCGNPRAARGRHCSTDLTTLTAPPADSECLSRQERYDSALAADTATVLGERVSAATYHRALRSLTVLMMHIATATDSPFSLPEWAWSLNQRTTGGATPTRAPRWGIAPPEDTELRSRALTSADRVLDTANIDEAMTLLALWITAIPRAPGGSLGWVADHSIPSPIMTGLVMAAHAPRRRLSHALDSIGPLTPRLENIPQAIPQHLSETHLTGLFTSRPETVRTFASLCLARTHPGVDNWAGAAHSLGLDPRLGIKTAQACTATQQADTTHLVQAIQSLAAELPEQDFREQEQRVRELIGTNAWFTRWARLHRPGTRPTSISYALTCLWTSSAQGHIATSPGWARSPDRDQRARYRRFVQRLTTDQLASLHQVLEDKS